jgi:hypothetical protein
MAQGSESDDVLDFGVVKVHPPTGTVGRVIGHEHPKSRNFRDYVVLLELPDESHQFFRFVELRDAARSDLEKFGTLRGQGRLSSQ